MTEEQADRRPGDEASLHALYAAVPTAEELDLADGLAPSPDLPAFDPPRGEDIGDVREDAPEAGDEDEEVTPLTDGQARGVLEHLLGAEPVEDEDEDD